MSWKDEDIDKLYQDRANAQSFEYKDTYWKEMEAGLPVSTPVGSETSAADNAVDDLYRAKSKDLSFEYKNTYWHEMAAMLPNRRRIDFVWFFTAFIFMGLIGTASFVNVPTKGNNVIAQNTALVNKATLSSSNKSADTKANGTTEVAPIILSPEDLQWTFPLDFDLSNNYYMPTCGGVIYDEPSPFFYNPSLPEILPSTLTDNTESGDVDRLPLKELERTQIGKDVINIPPIPFPPAKPTFYVEANGGLSQSLITPSDQLSYSFGVGIGTQIQRGKFQFTLGVNGIWSNHSDIILNRQAKVYGFGSTITNYTINYQQIYSLEAVLSLGYTMGNHTISLGCRPSFIVGSKVGYQESDSYNKSERTVVYNYMDGLSRFGVKPMIGYAFNITPGFTVGLNISTQLMKSVNEDYIDGVNNTLPIDGQLFLRKTISFK